MSLAFTLIFVTFLLGGLLVRAWLSVRQIRHVAAHADRVPERFADRIAPEAHRKAAAYTIARERFALFESAWTAALVTALTLAGGLQWLSDALVGTLGTGFGYQIGLIAVVALLLAAADLPFDAYRQFVIEQRFGFNRMTPALFLGDAAKAIAVTALLGLPLAAVVLWLMAQAGAWWWLYAWGVWVAFTLALLVLYPTVIAPMFNKFEPLSDATLAQRIDGLLERTGFSSRGVFVMDGSKRSSHGNAYFSGFGRAKRIVFFDTLIERLQPAEIEAVLAHELGHFRLRHIAKRMAFSFAASLALLALLGWLAGQTWFYTGLGVEPIAGARTDALALVLFLLALPVFTFVAAPLAGLLSRRHEFEADAFAARHASAQDLVAALVKLYQDNASTLTPDPLHSAFYDSHPPASIRIDRLLAAARPA